jgi:hypothetical protein
VPVIRADIEPELFRPEQAFPQEEALEGFSLEVVCLIEHALSVSPHEAVNIDQSSPSAAVGQKRPGNASLYIRRVHLFLGLFLTPWMIMYALSTWVMHHHEFVAGLYGSKTPKFVLQREFDYTNSFPAGAAPEVKAAQIVRDAGLDGTHNSRGGKNGQSLVIDRLHPRWNERITFDPATSKIRIEKEDYRTDIFLNRLHRRRGYQHPYALEDSWAVLVDVAIVGMVFWCLSGVWLWWEIRQTRRWGALSLAAGCALFVFFMAMI